jgi:hypothetical protein
LSEENVAVAEADSSGLQYYKTSGEKIYRIRVKEKTGIKE